MLRKLLLLAPLLLPLAAHPAAAQMESREGIALQNQILQLRQELDQVRRSGGGGGYPAPVPVAPPSRGGAPAGSPELMSQLLDRISQLEDETRRLRGQAQETEYRNRTLQQAVEKLQGDMDYRLQQLEQGGGAGGRPAAPAAAPRQRSEA
ncbi:YbgF trimerization domain-containing protein, partial [Pseudoroseomonas deserti]|uniref:YbgF trimerization domain-containing protein n=1 Tax=Teichococcus deserti TaxID=1817963 RepID=UPI0024188128